VSQRDDVRNPGSPQGPKVVPHERPLPSIEQVSATYRQLADAYSKERVAVGHERTWQRIELKAALRRRAFSPRVSSTVRWAGWSLVAAAAAAVVVFAAWPSPSRLEYALEGGSVEQGWVVTSKDAAHLEFTDGSELRLGAESALSVDALGPHSALSRLARGRVRVDVEHHDDTKWTFLAGPYEVRVEGTSFDLSWQAEQLEVNMHEGRVRVVGPNQHQWVLTKGDDLVVPRPEAVARQADAQPNPDPVTGVTEGQAQGSKGAKSAEGATEASQGQLAAAESVASPNASGKRADWGKLLKQGRFAEIVSDAKEQGTAQVLRSRGVADVEALAQAARYTGDVGLAEEAWKSIRARAPGSGQARQSAFFLGRVMEQQGHRSEAIQWFARYREEAPGGVYAGQALGRQLVLTSGQGRSGAARGLAEEYLQRFPNGPYAKAARGVLGGEAQGLAP
jgi:hypothetical protein